MGKPGRQCAPQPEHFPLRPLLAVAAGQIIVFGLTVLFVIWFVQGSQHKWCDTINLLNAAPAPAAAKTPGSSPARDYDRQLATDFRTLKGRLGCLPSPSRG